ncbi:short-chain dehydrogenase [Amycolatopsis orientalis]|uniref:Short-chain dehydrogenase n=1 Tax=Amycolatopsis orientalis TaxID=31958 RepID=A0A193BYA5_AMYOR|nr:SDR family NAD(P)-dependent oxidoreductase [Amycolatopsis orientalis]ANN17207.1 short-chain dehydrogenase [Amycolatopsis orientalis]
MTTKIVIVAGGTTGMGRATALARAARGDQVTVIGRARRGLPDSVTFLSADLSSVAEVDRVAAEIANRHVRVDALTLFANRPMPQRTETADGFEYTFALYYLSRYLLGTRLAPLMDTTSVIVNVAGVGTTAGEIHWPDPQLRDRYSMVRAQLQAGRANDLLGVSHNGKARYVLYHPGFTRSGLDLYPNPVIRGMVKTLGRLFARPVEKSVAPILGWIDHPPSEALTAVDRGKPVKQSLKTLDPGAASRLATYTERLLTGC